LADCQTEIQNVKKLVVLGAMAFSMCASLFSFNPVAAQSGAWLDITGDDGKPVTNMRAPVELTNEVDRLKGVNAIGAGNPDVTIVEFMDYNCPYCRKAAGELEALVRGVPGVRVKFVQNAITSPQSEEAARVDLAAFRVGGSRLAYTLHQRLYQRRGVNDKKAALALAAEIGLDPAVLDTLSEEPEIKDVLSSQMQLSASLGLNGTPSFLIAGMIVVGYPGPDTMRRIVESVLKCDAMAC
jgi:protein-disulfide isomerase